MNAPHAPALAVPRAVAPRRSRSAPRTRSSCWPKSTRSCAQGKDIVSFCIGQPDFPTPEQHPGRGDRGDPRRQARLHAVAPASTNCAPPRRSDLGARRGLDIHARRRRRRRRRQALHRLHDRVGHRLRRRRRSDLSGAGISDLRVADPRQRRACRCRYILREAREFAFDPAELEAKITPKTRLLILNYAAESDRRHARPRRSRRDRGDPARGIRRSGCSPTRSIRGSCYDGEFDSLATPRRHARAHDHLATARRRPGR